MATYTELRASRSASVDSAGVKRGLRQYLVDLNAEAAKTDADLNSEVPTTWDGMNRDRLDFTPASHTPNSTLISAVYSTNGSGRFTKRPEDPEPGDLRPRSSHRKERRTYPAGQTLTEEAVGSPDNPAFIYLWDIPDATVVVRPFVYAIEVVIPWGSNESAAVGMSLINARAGELHDVIPNEWFQFEPGSITPLGNGEWRAVYQWVSDPGIPYPTDEDGEKLDLDDPPDFLGPPEDPEYAGFIIGPWRQVVAKTAPRPTEPDSSQLPREFQYADQGRRIRGGHNQLPGMT